MAVWGYDSVYIEKDAVKREWRVYTPETRQHLVTVPWTDAFKTFKHAPDYSEAIATCQANERIALTDEEEQWVLDEVAGKHVAEPATPATTLAAPSNVIPLRRKT